ncbi:metal-dependent hydrolase [Brevibacterium marinum]|nr:metal-dependent hydrolase [Brevibacterium marinum]
MYFGGDVYSSVDPFATALGTKDGKVSFIGSDEAAQALDPDAIDLDGDFLTPGFVHAGLRLGADAPSGDRLIELGFTHVHILGSSEAVERFRAHAPQSLTVIAYPTIEVSSTDSSSPESRPSRASITADDFLNADAMPETSLYIDVDSNRRLAEVLDRLEDNAASAQRNGYRLLLDFGVDDELVTRLGHSGIAITLDPALPQPAAEMLSAGAQVSWTHSQESPWASVRSAVVGEHGIGARAAFNAATRFAHRAAGDPDGGVLAPGAEADFVRWQVERLVVQVADPRVAAWSTDPRSGTPGLPELSPEVALPTRIPVDEDD